MKNELILKGLDSALKALGVSDLDESILQPVKFDAFVRTMQRRTNILQQARFIPMDSQSVDIDRIGFADRVITRAIKPDGTLKGTESKVQPSTSTNKLRAVEMRGSMGVTDRALRRNIERDGFSQTLQDLFAESSGRDVEEYGIIAREDTITDPEHLGAGDGWAELAGNKVYNVDDTATGTDGWPVNLFDEMIDALPKQYLVDPSDWRIFVPWSVLKDYRDYLRDNRQTVLGDSATTNGNIEMYNGFRIEVAAMLERSKDFETDGHMGDICMLQHPDNMVWGVFHEMTIEPDRDPENRATNFYLTIEADVGYEDENAAVTAYPDATS